MIICVVIIVFVCMRLFVVIYFRFLSINNMCTIMIVMLCHWDSSERGLRYYNDLVTCFETDDDSWDLKKMCFTL